MHQNIETFGKYQLAIYALITWPLILSAGFTLDYVFTAGEVKYRYASSCLHSRRAFARIRPHLPADPNPPS